MVGRWTGSPVRKGHLVNQCRSGRYGREVDSDAHDRSAVAVPRIATAIVIAKRPLPGLVKTRLVPPFTLGQAADLAAAALRDTLRAVERMTVTHRVLSFDADPLTWLPAGWSYHQQPVGGLDQRLAAAFDVNGPAVLVGMDTPQLEPEQLSVFDPTEYDACLGLAEDGGFWAIGLRDPSRADEALLGIAMSTRHTAAEQLVRLRSLGMRVQLLDPLADVDTVDVAREVALNAPHTEFAEVFGDLLPAAVA